jgi:predicted transcriptional regulator
MARIPAKRIDHDEAAVLDRRKTVADMYLRGKTQHEIGRHVGVSQAQISRDLAAVREEWRQSAIASLDEAKARELAKVDALEATAWEAWERSCRDAETLHAETTKGRATKDGAPLPDLSRQAKTVKGQAGDPRFLERVAWCVERRCKILGLDAAQKHEHSLTVEERRSRLTGLLASLRDRAGTDRN